MAEKYKENKIDEDRYSRLIFTYGIETLKILSTMKILIVGIRGLGIETAKNIILNGPQEVDIFDPSLVKINDLGCNFFLTEDDVGKKNRDEACIGKLSELNPYVKVSLLKLKEKKEKDEQYIKEFCEKIENYNVVVFTEIQPMNFLTEIDKFCREKNIKLIYGFCFGLVGYIFTDFGNNHIIFDENGEEPLSYLVKSISHDKEGLVTFDTIEKTNISNRKLCKGDFVKFKNIGGMTELNDENREFQIDFENFESFRIGDTSNFGEYTRGGVVYEVKKPKKMKYLDFGSTTDLSCNISFSKYSKNAKLLYLAYFGVHEFYLKNNYTLPELNNMEQAKNIEENVKKMYNDIKKNNNSFFSNIQEYDEKIVLNVARWAAANIPPICSFFGGIVAQEIIKTIGKYIPINQWFIYDFFETVENVKDDAQRALKKSRYDDQIAIFGNEIQEKIQKSNIFMVGAGATGCEFLKNFAMMGFCSDKNSKFTVTDNDNIEISNLTRQFLFREKNVGKSKSIVAIESVKEMNHNFNGEAMQTKVCDKTEDIFNQEFWDRQNMIIYAVDSDEARRYIDNKVIIYQKFAVDAGTLGNVGRSQIIIPHKTLTYSDNQAPEKASTIPACTLRHFPSIINHCIEWSRDSFCGYFGNIISEVKEFFENYESFKENIKKRGSPINQLKKLNILKMHIDMIVNKDIKLMCQYAIENYTEIFDHNIQHLLMSFPPDHKNKEGSYFWGGSKRLPHPIKFDTNIDLCLIYITKFIQILSHALGIQFTKKQLSQENIKRICSSIKIPDFDKTIKKIDLDEEENKSKKTEEINEEKLKIEIEKESKKQEMSQKKINEIFAELDKIKREDFDYEKINPEDFEKDHDENGHIDFINALTNLRARNYDIDECDRNKTKEIAGDIKPTILTTTSSISGIVSLQFYTIFQTNEKKYFRDCYFNLSCNEYMIYEPSKPHEMRDNKNYERLKCPVKAIPEGWNIWDIIEINETKTCGQLIDYLEEKYKISIDSLIADGISIANRFIRKNIEKEKLKIEDAYEAASLKKISYKKKFLIIQISGKIKETLIENETFKNVFVLFPLIKYKINK